MLVKDVFAKLGSLSVKDVAKCYGYGAFLVAYIGLIALMVSFTWSGSPLLSIALIAFFTGVPTLLYGLHGED